MIGRIDTSVTAKGGNQGAESCGFPPHWGVPT